MVADGERVAPLKKPIDQPLIDQRRTRRGVGVELGADLRSAAEPSDLEILDLVADRRLRFHDALQLDDRPLRAGLGVAAALDADLHFFFLSIGLFHFI